MRTTRIPICPSTDSVLCESSSFSVANGRRDFRRFVYASSTSIYGNCRHIPADELDPPNILNHYAATKLLGENYTTLYYMAYGVPTVCVRCSNVYGPGQTTSDPYCGVIGKFFDAAEAGRPLAVHGDGEQTRDYAYVNDAVEGTLRATAAPQALGDVFNIGTGVETSVNTLAHEIRALTGGRARIEYIDRRDIDNIRRRALSPKRSASGSAGSRRSVCERAYNARQRPGGEGGAQWPVPARGRAAT